MSDFTKKVAKAKKADQPTIKVRAYLFRMDGLSDPITRRDEPHEMEVKSLRVKDINRRLRQTRGPLSTGIGNLVKVYKVNEDGSETFVINLFPAYKIVQRRNSKSVRTYAKPQFSYNESLTAQDVQP